MFNADDLARFDAVVFLNATGDMLSEQQERAFERWLEGGGGWLGVHAAGDDSHANWQWYVDQLVGVEFIGHILGPQMQTATVLMESPEHPANRAVSPVWEHEEEWYSWNQSPRARGFTVLAVVEEDSYVPVRNLFGRQRSLSMGDHPVVWSNCVGAGRAVYSALGHRAEAFEHPQYVQLLTSALSWAHRSGRAPLPGSSVYAGKYG